MFIKLDNIFKPFPSAYGFNVIVLEHVSNLEHFNFDNVLFGTDAGVYKLDKVKPRVVCCQDIDVYDLIRINDDLLVCSSEKGLILKL